MKAIETPYYDELVHTLFMTDPELLSAYHIEAPASLEKCADRTVKDLRSCDTLRFYKVLHAGSVIGFFGTEQVKMGQVSLPYLTTFFVHPKHRNKKDLSEFMTLVRGHFDHQPFFSALYGKNTRAIAFFKRQGAIEREKFYHQGEPIHLFHFPSEDICQ